MDNFTLLPSANWNMSHMLVVNETGNICAYGSRGDILIIKNADKDNFGELDSKIISSALKNARVMGLAFVKCEIEGQMKELLASCGDDGRIKIWDYEQGIATHKAILKDKEVGVQLMSILHHNLEWRRIYVFVFKILQMFHFCRSLVPWNLLISIIFHVLTASCASLIMDILPSGTWYRIKFGPSMFL